MSTMADSRNSSASSNSEKVDFLSLDGELKNGEVFFQGKSMSELALGMDESSIKMSKKTEQALVSGASQVALSSPDHLYIYERTGNQIVLHTFKIPQALQAATLKAMGVEIESTSKDGIFDPVARYDSDEKIDFSLIPKALDVLTGKKHALEAVSLPKIEAVVRADNTEKAEVKIKPQEESKAVPAYIRHKDPPDYLLNSKKNDYIQPEKKAAVGNLVFNKEEPLPRLVVKDNNEQKKVTEHWHLKEKKRLLDKEITEKKVEVGQSKIQEKLYSPVVEIPRKYSEVTSTAQVKLKDKHSERFLDVRPEASSQVRSEIRRVIKSDKPSKYEARQETKVILQREEHRKHRKEVKPYSKERIILNRPIVQTKESPLNRISYIRENISQLKKTLREKVAVKRHRGNLPEPYNIFKINKDTHLSLSQALPRAKRRIAVQQPSRINFKSIPAPNLDSFNIESSKRPARIQAVLKRVMKFAVPIVSRIKENQFIRKAVSNVKLLAAKLISKLPEPVRLKSKVVFEKTRIVIAKLLNESVRQLKHFAKDVTKVVQSAKNLFKYIYKAISRTKLNKDNKSKKILMRPKISRKIFPIPRRSRMTLNKKLKKKIKLKKRSGAEDLRSQEHIWEMMKKKARRKRKFIKYSFYKA